MKNFRQCWLSVLSIMCLTMAVTCHKASQEPAPVAEPPCDDGSCCNPPYKHIYISSLENAPADLDLYALIVKDPPGKSQRVPICPVSWNILKGLESTFFKDSIQQYKYRIWGKIYENKDVITYSGEPLYSVKINRIEKVK